MGMSVVVFGNPVDGIQVIGPFDTGEDATRWADLVFNDGDWWVVPLEATEEFDA